MTAGSAAPAGASPKQRSALTDCAYRMLQVMDMLLSDLARFKLVEEGAETFTRKCQGVWQTQHPGEPVSKVDSHFASCTTPPALRQGFAASD